MLVTDFSLDDPIKKLFSEGYGMCRNCGKYFHHPFRWCPNCGTRTHKEKEMSWREFLKITARYGSGPLNTIYCHLAGGWNWEALKNNPEKLKIYEEAKQIWKDNGGDSAFVRGEETRKCPRCGYEHQSLYTMCYLCRTTVVLKISIKANKGEKLTAEERFILRTIRNDWRKIHNNQSRVVKMKQ